MSILKVARLGHPILRQPARAIESSEIGTPRVQRLIDDMLDTMREYQGAGLAAPQVHAGLRLVVVGVGMDDEAPETPGLVVINPEIRAIGTAIVEDWEGCLSLPDLRGKVPRASEVDVRGYDRHGERLRLHATDFPARVFQHETDHLDGILFVDRMRSFETLTFLDEYSRYWGKEDTPPE